MYIIFGKKTVAAVLSAAVLITAVLITGSGIRHNAALSASAETNWGLSFQTEGQPPVGNATAQQLRDYNAYYIGNTNEKKIFLTFDAGYENGYTEHILDVLKKHKAPAAFFLVGNYIETSPDLVKRMVNEGHTVGNHTFTHPDMSAITDKESFSDELNKLEKLFKDTTGTEMKKFYRPPQGKYSQTNLQMAKDMGYTTVFWSLAYADWLNDNQPSHDDALSKLIPRTHNGAVVLLHSTSKTNSEILDELLTEWEKQGYTFADISELSEQ